MCGIAGIIGSKNASNFLYHALTVLQTRGYDGYGIGIQGKPVVKTGQ